MGELPRKDTLPVLPEVEKLRGERILCFMGEKESGSLCRDMDAQLAKVFVLPGSHHFGGEYDLIAEAIFEELP